MSTLDYTIKRVRKLYPHLILSFLCFFIITYYYCGLQSIMYELVSHLYQVIPMMYYIMPGDTSISYLNYSVWYVSILLIVGIFVHYMYSRCKHAFVNCIAPLIMLVGYYYLVQNCTCFNTGAPLGPFLNDAYIRGITDMCGGIVIYNIILRVKRHHFRSLAYIMFRVLEIAAYAILLFFIRYKGNNSNDFYFLLIIYFGVLLSFLYPNNQDIVFDKFKCINDLMYPVYLNHLLFIVLMRRIQIFEGIMEKNKLIGIVLFFIGLCIFSYMTKKILNVIELVWKHLRKYFIVEE